MCIYVFTGHTEKDRDQGVQEEDQGREIEKGHAAGIDTGGHDQESVEDQERGGVLVLETEKGHEAGNTSRKAVFFLCCEKYYSYIVIFSSYNKLKFDCRRSAIIDYKKKGRSRSRSPSPVRKKITHNEGAILVKDEPLDKVRKLVVKHCLIYLN